MPLQWYMLYLEIVTYFSELGIQGGSGTKLTT